ncbi:MAG: pyruvate kinase, partial [Gemmatimonadetes bacterium]|nr:pyruvate kinase [Gemmatimonadota bacterium]NIQ55110.1 pyruvate kinase [Gemmatimonadota bacterium]NIU75306.1 pyruvate kinase [Gammaproteobacteria bacterium]NIX45092.1 pyruvate kinase [Gemmatimonadota bacterium]NIY09345.1 pyruvate kinase [Gemmatimonadota bacterium]
MERHTKIVATLGPAVASADRIRELIRAGMDVARLNFSHGDHELHRRLCHWVREAASAEEKVVAVLQDIQGPKLRVGTFPGGRIELEAGDRVTLLQGRGEGGRETVYLDYDYLLDDVRAGET